MYTDYYYQHVFQNKSYKIFWKLVELRYPIPDELHYQIINYHDLKLDIPQMDIYDDKTYQKSIIAQENAIFEYLLSKNITLEDSMIFALIQSESIHIIEKLDTKYSVVISALLYGSVKPQFISMEHISIDVLRCILKKFDDINKYILLHTCIIYSNIGAIDLLINEYKVNIDNIPFKSDISTDDDKWHCEITVQVKKFLMDS